jgi:hypothetical protein
MRFSTPVFSFLLALAVCPATARADFASPEEGLRFFEERIRPVLSEKCYSCHSAEAEKLKGALQVDHREHLLAGGDTGAALVAGRPDESLLLEAIAYGNPDLQMPPKERLAASVVEDFRRWIAGGAPWPDEPVPEAGKAVEKGIFDLEGRRASHWSWRPVASPPVPTPEGAGWGGSPIDAFLLEKIEAAGLRPAEPADERTWLRRVHYDLVGLPPSPGEIAAFLADTSADRREKVVDALLASPHFGEKWARHWMDLVRYAETHGHEFDYPIDHAFEYRDYLVRAFNADLPFDLFAKEHIAGDLLANPRRHPSEGFDESVLGTGFWYLNEATHAPTDVLADEADHQATQIDVYAKAFLGLTVSCARCHDHKFDAISTADYYALTAYLRSSARTERPMDPGARRATAAARQRELLAKADATLPEVPTASKAAAAGEGERRLFADFEGDELPSGWTVVGEAFAPTGTSPRFTLEEGLVFTTPGTVSSARLGGGHSGVLRSPTFEIESDAIHVRLRAKGGMMRVVIDNYHMAIHSALLFRGTLHKDPDTKGEFVWMRFEGDLKKYRGHRAYLEFVDPGPGFYEIDEIRFDAPPSAASGGPAPGPSAPVDPEAEALLGEGRRLAASLPPERFALTMAEATPQKARVYVRGSHRSLGEEVPGRFLTALGGREGDRLALAEETVSPDNPLFSRVAVNRLWHHLFGRGLVPSIDDFGPMGQAPSHPELLDWLAADFVAGGWSVKRAIRQIVLTKAYAQASVAHPSLDPAFVAEADPGNVLLHRMPVRRLVAEAIRDSVLAVAGSLDPALFGPSIPTHRTDFMTGRGARASGPLDGAGRRSLYGAVYRNFLPPLLTTFDMPAPFGPKGARSVSNVPAQALALMNDPFVAEEARRWGARVHADAGADDKARLVRMVEAATGRQPDPSALATLAAFLEEQSTLYGARDERVWSDLAHALFNSKDFLFLR